MALTPSGVETIRKEVDAQSRAITRLGILRIAALLLLAVSFSKAFQRLDASQSEREMLYSRMVQQAIIVYGDVPKGFDPPWVFEFTPYQSPFVPAFDCARWHRSYRNRSDPRDSRKALAADAWLDACQRLQDLHRQAFLLKLPLGGSDIEVDLSWWVFLAPLLFVLAELYLAILRKKRLVLSRSALSFKGAEGAGELPISDRLFLSSESGKEAPFIQHPYQYSRFLDLALCGGLVAFLMFASRPVWRGFAGEMVRFLLLFYGTAIFYAGAYYRYVVSQLNTATQRAFGSEGPEPLRSDVWKRWKEFTFRAQKRVGARIPISVGVLLLVSTLLLPISIVSCNDVSKYPKEYAGKRMGGGFVYREGSGISLAYVDFGRGYKLFMGKSLWPPAFYGGAEGTMSLPAVVGPRQIPDAPTPAGLFSQRLGVLAYRVMLVLAVLGAFMQIEQLRPKRARTERNIYLVGYVASCAALVSIVTDMAFAWLGPRFPPPVYWLMTVFWFAGMLAILASKLAAGERIRRTVFPIAAVAGIVYAPVPLYAAAFLVPWHSAKFVASFSTYLVGTALLAFGYSALLEKSRARV